MLAQDPKISTSVLEGCLGWQHGSKMAATYVHQSGKDVEQAIRSASGLGGELAAPSPSLPKPKKRPRCHSLSASDATYCATRGVPVVVATGIADANRIDELERRVKELRSLISTFASTGKPYVVKVVRGSRRTRYLGYSNTEEGWERRKHGTAPIPVTDEEAERMAREGMAQPPRAKPARA